jgi:hypothetical protein
LRNIKTPATREIVKRNKKSKDNKLSVDEICDVCSKGSWVAKNTPIVRKRSIARGQKR